jgi:shikimate dehydrogenase
MHNAGFAAGGEDAVYVPFEAADLEDFVSFAERLRVRGVSVTAPFKQTLLARVEDIDATSRQVGALNTVRIDGRRWQGLNTDVPGFLEPLQRFDLAGSRAAVVGAGGAARAVCVALASRRAKVAVYARDGARAAEVARLAGGTAHPMPPPPGSWDVLVNTTPVGTYPHGDQTPMPGGVLDGRLVYDLVYNPLKTRLVVDAERAGCQTIGGLEMLVAQAERQFEWWTGRRPGPALFKQAALRRLGELGGVTGEVGQRP